MLSPYDSLPHIENGGDIQMLFIKRTQRGGDRWSGDTAFPGGYLNVGESDFDGVKREVLEELNINLDDETKYVWLRRLRHVNFGDKSKILYPHVFLYLGHDDPPLQLAPAEVAGVEWVNISTLLQRSFDSFDTRSASLDSTFLRVAGWSATTRRVATGFAGVLNCSTVHFPCIHLPISSRAVWSGASTSSLEASHAPHESREGTVHWVLWGMTLRFVCDLLQAGNQQQQPYLCPKLPFWVDNKLFNVYLQFWHDRLVYSGSHTVSGTALLSLSLAGLLGTYAAAAGGILWTGNTLALFFA
jgi:8-oxo-dGTP pyrophosphatase MutT (NUDIX family)